MKAVYIKEFGGPENLEIRDLPDPPKPRGADVLVRVHAAALNRADLLQRKGLYPAPPGYSTNIPGLEFAGEVVDIGDRVRRWEPGDRVMAIAAGEAQAELVTADESLLMTIPDRLSYSDAAAIPEAYITAHDAVFTLGDVRAGQTLLVHAAGSGVGIAAVQMALVAGAKVIGTSRSEDKLERLSALLRNVIVPAGGSFAADVKQITDGIGAEVILDLVGASYFSENLASLANQGRLILVGLTGGSNAQFDLRAALQKRVRIIGTVLRGRSIEEKAEATQAFVDHSMQDLRTGSLFPVVDKVFAAADIRVAHEYLESNKSFGKVVLKF